MSDPMSAEEALDISRKAILAKQQEEKSRKIKENERREKDEKYYREVLFPEFLDDSKKIIREWALKTLTYTNVYTTNEIVANMALAQFKAEGYNVSLTNQYVPEDNDYGDSGHPAYWNYMLHISWGER